MRKVLIQLLVIGAVLGCAECWGQPAADHPAAVPEIPITVLDAQERLRLILNQLSAATNGVSWRAEPAKSVPATAVPPAPAPENSAGRIQSAPPTPQSNLQSVSSVPPQPSGTTMAPVLAPTFGVAADARHVLREGDFIEIKVYQEDELNTRDRLDNEGAIMFPLLGRIHLGGLTVEQARTRVQTLLGEDYLVSPQVVIAVVEYAKRRFAVMGQVQQPGFFNIPENERINLLQAVSMAGGFTRLANPSSILIKRTTNGTETVIRANAKAMGRETEAKLLQIQAEDTIIVSERVF